MALDPTVLGPRHFLRRAKEEFELGRIRHLPIVDREGKLLGLVTQRDLLAAGEHLDRPISQVMQSDVTTVSPDTPAYEAAYLMLRDAIGCVPVTESDGRLIGIVTDTDFVRVAYTALGGMVPVDQLVEEDSTNC